MLTFPSLGVFSFVGKHGIVEEAVAEASALASAFLATHVWCNADGRSAYTHTTALHMERDGYIFVITLIGPPEPTT